MEAGDSFSDVNVDVLYGIAHQFLLDKADKAFRPSFDERVRLSALSLQAKYGKYRRGEMPAIGFFDITGQQRINQWKALGDMSPEAAKVKFVEEVKRLCPIFLIHLEARLKQTNVSEKLRPVEAPTSSSETAEGQGVDQSLVQEKNILLHNQKEIRSALNGQTKEQFETYAMQHYPNDPQRRMELLADLQERHFRAYTNFIEQQLLLQRQQQQSSASTITTATIANGPTSKPGVAEQLLEGDCVFTHVPAGQRTLSSANSVSSVATAADDPTAAPSNGPEKDEDEKPDVSPGTSCDKMSPSNGSPTPLVLPANMWTRGDIAEFKAQCRDAVYTISCGEMLTVRIPTDAKANCFFWEFATDSYDLAFGLFFEWLDQADHHQLANEPVPRTPPSLFDSIGVDALGPASSQPDVSPANLVEEIIAVSRRNCHQEVYCGQHPYPGAGQYLIQFDNTYSMWRSKLLYFHVYHMWQ